MANKNLNTRIVLRNDTKANWQSVNPILMKGELGVEFDPSATSEDRKILFKIGDGVTNWNDLPYGGGDFAEIIQELISDVEVLKAKVGTLEFEYINNQWVPVRITRIETQLNPAITGSLAAQVSASVAAINVLNGDASVQGSVAYQIASSVATGAVVASAIDEKISAAVGNLGGYTTVAAAISAVSAAASAAQSTANSAATAAGVAQETADAAASAAAAAQITANSAASAAVAAQGRADEAYTLASQASAAAGSASEAIAALEAILPKNSFTSSQTVAGALSALDGRIDALEGNHFEIAPASADPDRHPDVANPQFNVIYLVPKPDGFVGYAEWIRIEQGSPATQSWEKIGDTDVDLSNYYTKTQSDGRYAPITHNHDSSYAPITHNHDDRYFTQSQLTATFNLIQQGLEGLDYQISLIRDNYVANTTFNTYKNTTDGRLDTIEQALDPTQAQSLPSRITAVENDLDVDETGSLAARFAVVEGAYASKNYVDNNFVKNNDVLILDCGNASTNYSAS